MHAKHVYTTQPPANGTLFHTVTVDISYKSPTPNRSVIRGMEPSEQIGRALKQLSQALERPVGWLGLEQEVVDTFAEFHIYGVHIAFSADGSTVFAYGTLVGIPK